MAQITSIEGIDGLPGYLATMQLTAGTPGASMFRPAWNRLELFPAKAAEAFLTPKVQKLIQIKDPDAAYDAAIEIILGFAIMAVFADRENTEYVEGIERQVEERITAAAQANAIEKDAEERATEDTSINW